MAQFKVDPNDFDEEDKGKDPEEVGDIWEDEESTDDSSEPESEPEPIENG